MTYKIVTEAEGAGHLLYQLLHHILRGITVVQPEVVARLQVYGDCTVGILLQINLENFLGHVVVVQFVIAQGNVHVQREVISAKRTYRVKEFEE